MKEVREQQQQQGMYRPEFEHDNCGIGAVVNIKGKKTHDTVANALKIVEHLEHRAGKDAEGKTGDGVNCPKLHPLLTASNANKAFLCYLAFGVESF